MRRQPTPSATPPPVGARRGHSRLFHLRWLRRIPRNEAPPFARMRKDHRARGLSLQQLEERLRVGLHDRDLGALPLRGPGPLCHARQLPFPLVAH